MLDEPAPVFRLESFSALQRAEIAEIRRLLRLHPVRCGFSALQRAEIAEMVALSEPAIPLRRVSVLFNEPKLLKLHSLERNSNLAAVSVLFNEPKLLKFPRDFADLTTRAVSVLFNEPKLLK